MSYSPNGHATLESMSQAVWYNTWTMDKFRKYLRGDILEAGCGIGNFTPTLLLYGSVWAIDIDPKCIHETKKKLSGANAHVGYGDIEKGRFFFNKKKFDTVVCVNVLEHIQNDAKTLKNLYTLLKPKGHLVLLVPAHPFLYGSIDQAIDHYRRYSRNELSSLLRSTGFRIEFSRILNILGAIGWFVSGRIFRNESVHTRRLKLFNAVAPLLLPIEDIFEPPFGTSILVVARR